MTRGTLEAQKYARMSDVDRCAYAGALMRRTTYALKYFGPEKAAKMAASGYAVARTQQTPEWIAGNEDVRTHIFMGGRASGKTFSATGWIVPEILERPEMRVAVLGPDFKTSVGVGIKGRSGIKTIIDKFDKTLISKFDEVKNILHMANGSQVFCFSSEYPKSLEGPEFSLLWVDEVAELYDAKKTYRERIEPAVRLLGDNGEPIRKIVTGTPEATELIADLWESSQKYPDAYAWTQLATRDNIDNLDARMVEQTYREAGDSLFAKMKLEGQLILESPNALLSESDLARCRVELDDERHVPASKLKKLVLCVDASHSDDKKSDECGIIVAGKHGSRAHIVADASGNMTALEWGLRIIDALVAFPEIDNILVEDDKSLVITVIENVLKEHLRRIGRPIKIVRMKDGNRSKKMRADPVAAEYQLLHVLHDPSPRVPEWSDLSKLEWQWKSWNPKAKTAKSPDRVDACVYAVIYLVLSEPGETTFHRAGG